MKALFPFAIVFALWMSPAVADERESYEPLESDSLEEVSARLEQALDPAIRQLEETMPRIDAVEKQLGAAAEEVRRAERDMHASSGMLARVMALDRLRESRQTHHRLSRQLKESRQQLSQALRDLAQRAAQVSREMEEQVASATAGAVAASSEQAEQLKQLGDEMRKRQEIVLDQLEKRLERFAPLLRREMEPDFGFSPDRPGRFPPGPPPPPGVEPSGTPSLDNQFRPGWQGREDRQGRRGGWLFLQRHQQKMEAMERKIETLQQQVDELQKRLQQLEGGGRRETGVRNDSRQ